MAAHMKTALHPTVCREGILKKPISEGEYYKCQFCSKMGEYAYAVAHMQTHEKTTVKHGGYKIYRCHCERFKSQHYHCCYCARILTRQNLFLNHLQKCGLDNPSTVPCVSAPSVVCASSSVSAASRASAPSSTVSAACRASAPSSTVSAPSSAIAIFSFSAPSKGICAPSSVSAASSVCAPSMVSASSNVSAASNISARSSVQFLAACRTPTSYLTVITLSKSDDTPASSIPAQTTCMSNPKILKSRPKGTTCASYNLIVNKKNNKLHPTVCKDGILKKPISEGLQNYKCQFCCKRGEYAYVVAHMQTHEKTAVKHGGYKMYRCHCGFCKSPHYHCCYCERTLTQQNVFLNHLQKCGLANASIVPCASEPSIVSESAPSSVSAASSDQCRTTTSNPTVTTVSNSNDKTTSSTSTQTSNAKIFKSIPKRITCPFCNMILNKKNIKVHIQRRHSSANTDVKANHHLSSQSMD
ncbi:uncharacterized protein [Misgurnus anguillicaudatus]|uniref:uncharacterized protein isoform X1 n=2 Tax=Misgurnus anguillicaudatus TaxID=75329 RepID=UPI003CCF9BAF